MEIQTLSYIIAPYGKAILGDGAYSIVYRATEKESGRPVALKKSRVSRRVKRPHLRHEVRVLQLLKGHPAIPVVYGYGHLEHFEYLAMELLGPSVAEQQKDGAGLVVETVIRIVVQAFAALKYVHSLGIVHRDIKPENFLCTLNDPAMIKLADFGISKPFSCDKQAQNKYNPLEDRRFIAGSLYWASLNSHNGEDLTPRDDLESLAFVAFSLLRGNLPWKPRPSSESRLQSQEIVRILKSAYSGSMLSDGFPFTFGELLTYSRSLAYGQLPDYEKLRTSFASLAIIVGSSTDHRPLDWTPCYPQVTCQPLEEAIIPIIDANEDDLNEDDFSEGSYFGLDIDMWTPQGEREKDLTLPEEEVTRLDSITPVIGQVERD